MIQVAHRAPQDVGYALVLPWEIHHAGGVNGVVAALYSALDAGGDFAPYLMVSSWDHPDPELSIDERGRRTIRLRNRGFLSGDRSWVFRYAALLLRLPFEARKLLSAVERFRLRVVNVHYVTDSAFVWAVLKHLSLFRGSLVFSFHGTDVHVLSGQRGWSRWLYGWMLRQADVLVPCSFDMRTRLLDEFHVDPLRTRTVHNGIDTDAVLAATEHMRISREGAADHQPLIVSLGSFDRVKGHDVLVRAFETIARQRPDVRLLIAGRRGPELAALQELVKSAGLVDRVELRVNATHDQAMELLAGASVFALASRREGLPLTIIEAGVLRIPVVASHVGGIPELVRADLDGLLPPAENVEALCTALLHMLNNYGEAARMASSLHERVMSRHTLRSMAEGYMKVVQAGT